MEENLKEISDLAIQNVRYIFKKSQSRPEIFTHYAMMLNLIGRSYLETECHAVILTKIDGDLAISSINASEAEVVALMKESHEYVMHKVMEDAPDKAMFN